MRAALILLSLALAGPALAAPAAPSATASGLASLLTPCVVVGLALAIAVVFDGLSYDPEKAFIGGGLCVAAWAYVIRDTRFWHAVLIGFEAMAVLGLLFSLYALIRWRRGPGDIVWFAALTVAGAAAIAYVRPRGLF